MYELGETGGMDESDVRLQRAVHEPVIQTLRQELSADELAFDVPLSGLGRWQIGGPADIVVTPHSMSSLRRAWATIARSGVRHVVIGDGTNLLFDDAGYRGIIVRIGRQLSGMAIEPDGTVVAEAGLWVPAFVRRLIAAGLSGAIHAVGIPGTLGGLIVMNGGSQRRGIGEHVLSVDVVDAEGGLRRIAGADLGFAYRRSLMQAPGQVVASARLRFEPGDTAAMRREAIAIISARRAKFPRVRANCGSVFVSDPALYKQIGPPGAAIERVGLKGTAIGGAQISPEHANFIVNNGDARAQDVLRLVLLARQRVVAEAGVSMLAEVRYLPPEGLPIAAHDAAEALS